MYLTKQKLLTKDHKKEKRKQLKSKKKSLYKKQEH